MVFLSDSYIIRSLVVTATLYASMLYFYFFRSNALQNIFMRFWKISSHILAQIQTRVSIEMSNKPMNLIIYSDRKYVNVVTRFLSASLRCLNIIDFISVTNKSKMTSANLINMLKSHFSGKIYVSALVPFFTMNCSFSGKTIIFLFICTSMKRINM